VYYKLYNLVFALLTPFLYIYILIRVLKGKEDFKRLGERFGRASVKRKEGKLIWLHAASLGEAITLLILVDKLKHTFPKTNFLFTSGTINSAKVLKERLDPKIIHQFVPIDKKSFVRRFLKYWKPDFVIFVESEIWPNLIVESKKAGAELVLVNAKLSDKSYIKAYKHKSFYHFLLSHFSIILAQSLDAKEKLESLSNQQISIIKNLKFDAVPLQANPIEVGNYLNLLRNRKVFLAVSTHKGEEKIILETHKRLKLDFHNLLTIICPRHPIRTPEIEREIEKLELKYQVRTKSKSIDDDTDIYLANTVGELGLFFRLSEICFVGGSLVEGIGGHNPIEPAKLNLAIISGKFVENFQEIYKDMLQRKAVKMVENQNELIKTIHNLFTDKITLRNMISASFDFSQDKSGSSKEILQKIVPLIQKKLGVENIPLV
jgi:3-deoxy-D-manno-octulosonic-acid transferase